MHEDLRRRGRNFESLLSKPGGSVGGRTARLRRFFHDVL